MPSRWGPGVLPEPNYNFANALAGLQSGYGFGSDILAQRRQRQREQEEWQEHEEDRNRYLTQLRAGEEAQPGAMPLASFLQDPAYKKEVDVAATKAQPATAGGRLVFAPHFARDLYQEPTSGAVVSRGAAREQLLGDYLGRQMPIWQARGQIEQGKEDAALKRVNLQQTGATGRTELQQTGANQRLAAKIPARLTDPGTGQVYERQADGSWAPAVMGSTPAAGGAAGGGGSRPPLRLHPAPARPRAAGVAGEHDLAGWQRTLAQAQSALRDAEMGGTLGKAPDEPGAAPDQATFKDAAAYQVANAAYLRQVRRYHDWRTQVQQAQDQVRDAQQHVSQLQGGGGAAPAAAPPGRRPAGKSPQEWVDEVAAEPGWASKPDSLIIREARRREAASRGPR
jgi:hypothetical protein